MRRRSSPIELVPNFRAVGKRLGKAVPECSACCARAPTSGTATASLVGGHVLERRRLRGAGQPARGPTVEHEGAIAVGVDTALDDALVDEGIARDLVHHLQALRRDAGLAVTDRIRVTYAANERGEPGAGQHGSFIAGEVLAVALEPGPADGGV